MSNDFHLRALSLVAVRTTVLVLSLSSCLCSGCGGEAAVDVDQLVHDGPVAEPRPPRPVALDRATGELVRFSSFNGEVSSRLAPLDGEVIDAAVDDQQVWWIVERSGERRVAASGWDGALGWSRPLPRAQGVLPLGDGAVLVVAGRDWWAFEAEGGVKWRQTARSLRAAWSEPTGLTILTEGADRGQLTVWVVDGEGAAPVAELTAEAERFVAGPGGLIGLSLRDEMLSLRLGISENVSEFRALDLPWPGGQALVAAAPWPGQPRRVALASREAVGLLVVGDAPRLILAPLPSPMVAPSASPPQRRIWLGDDRIFVTTEAGVLAYSVDTSHLAEAGPRLTLDPRFEGEHLTVPLAGP